ncbi:hypothetical protein [Pseudofrankia inefficax]|uniref:DUF3558 domain-containing protein n=1 Tax=Pseudofrankia inefficax (strain DSM 45817 / CECT 9037 / DDB 130130 / EuI1c) TaxID=298654 RepID=E3IWW6_PSEI1|nr:hypothetical protein [Pseudofrankia inefficax]ADP82590.1 hypothetical protein FraEuI1c_4597 [Pseudofrankia inefficax]
MTSNRRAARIHRSALLLAAAAVLSVATTACGSSGPAPQAVAPCSLLTPAEISAAVGSTFGPGKAQVSVSNAKTLGCWFSSPKGYASLWSWRGAGPGARSAPSCDRKIEQADGSGYRALVCTNSANIQTVYVSKGNNYLSLEIGADARPGAARTLGRLAATRLP